MSANRKEISKFVIGTLQDVHHETVTGDTKLRGFGLSSLQLMEKLGKIEDKFLVSIDMEYFTPETTISDVEEMVVTALENNHQVQRESNGELVDDKSSLEQRLWQLGQRKRDLEQQKLYYFEQEIVEYHQQNVLTKKGTKLLLASSYSYLGLIDHTAIKQAAVDAVNEFGTGTHGVRLLAGTISLHRELEQTIAKFKHTDDAVVFNSGYVANLTTISTLVKPGDIVINDEYNHASIVDGCKISGAKTVFFKHNDMKSLEELLKTYSGKNILVICDAVFSMDGDIINLPVVSELCRQYRAMLMIDEAHSVGTIGKTGHGIEEHFGLPYDTIDIKMGTLSKTIPAVGGYIAAKQYIIDSLKTCAHAFIFSAAVAPPIAAAAMAAFKVIEAEPERVHRLQENVRYYLSELKRLGFNTLASETAVVPIICKDEQSAFAMTKFCQKQGLFALPVVYPAVPRELPRLRTTIIYNHTREDIDNILSVLVAARDHTNGC